MTSSPFKKAVILTLVLLFILLIGLMIYSENKFNRFLENPQVFLDKNADQTVKKLGKILQIPDEKPTVATIIDETKIKDQPFLAQAKKGDKLLIFHQAKIVVLFREAELKIINTGVLTKPN